MLSHMALMRRRMRVDHIGSDTLFPCYFVLPGAGSPVEGLVLVPGRGLVRQASTFPQSRRAALQIQGIGKASRQAY